MGSDSIDCPYTHAAGNLTDDGTRSYAWDAEQLAVGCGEARTASVEIHAD